MRRAVRGASGFLAEVLHRCIRHSIDSQSASLAFYTLFALAPMFLVVGSVAGSLFGRARVHDEVVRQLQGVIGLDAGRGVAVTIEKAAGLGVGTAVGAVTAVVAFVLGATAVFMQLHEALNRVWEVAARPGTLIRSMLKPRLVSLALVLAVGLVLLVSLTLSIGLLVLTDAVRARITIPMALVVLANELLSLLVFTALIALIYRTLPDANLEWRDVGIGAVLTAVLFSIGKWLIAFYLAQTNVASRFGVAGSVVVILVWVYGASTIVLFGAEVTAVHSSRRSRRAESPGVAIADPQLR